MSKHPSYFDLSILQAIEKFVFKNPAHNQTKNQTEDVSATQCYGFHLRPVELFEVQKLDDVLYFGRSLRAAGLRAADLEIDQAALLAWEKEHAPQAPVPNALAIRINQQLGISAQALQRLSYFYSFDLDELTKDNSQPLALPTIEELQRWVTLHVLIHQLRQQAKQQAQLTGKLQQLLTVQQKDKHPSSNNELLTPIQPWVLIVEQQAFLPPNWRYCLNYLLHSLGSTSPANTQVGLQKLNYLLVQQHGLGATLELFELLKAINPDMVAFIDLDRNPQSLPLYQQTLNLTPYEQTTENSFNWHYQFQLSDRLQAKNFLINWQLAPAQLFPIKHSLINHWGIGFGKVAEFNLGVIDSSYATNEQAFDKKLQVLLTTPDADFHQLQLAVGYDFVSHHCQLQVYGDLPVLQQPLGIDQVFPALTSFWDKQRVDDTKVYKSSIAKHWSKWFCQPHADLWQPQALYSHTFQQWLSAQAVNKKAQTAHELWKTWNTQSSSFCYLHKLITDLQTFTMQDAAADDWLVISQITAQLVPTWRRDLQRLLANLSQRPDIGIVSLATSGTNSTNQKTTTTSSLIENFLPLATVSYHDWLTTGMWMIRRREASQFLQLLHNSSASLKQVPTLTVWQVNQPLANTVADSLLATLSDDDIHTFLTTFKPLTATQIAAYERQRLHTFVNDFYLLES